MTLAIYAVAFIAAAIMAIACRDFALTPDGRVVYKQGSEHS